MPGREETADDSRPPGVYTKSEVDALGVRTISHGCFERCCSNKKTPPYHSNLSFVTLRTRRWTLLRAPAYRTPFEASPRRRCGHASRFLWTRSGLTRATLPVVQLSSKRVEEKWHNWYSTALFLYETSAPGEALTRMPRRVVSSRPLDATSGLLATQRSSAETFRSVISWWSVCMR